MSKIEWTDETWNPVIGCQKIAKGCTNCYAEKMACRLRAMGTRGYEDAVTSEGKWSGRVSRAPDHIWLKPSRWRKRRKVFVCSMSDLFYDRVPIEWIYEVFDIAIQNAEHIFMFLTKRPGRMRQAMNGVVCGTSRKQRPNIWIGTSASTQAEVNYNVNELLRIDAPVRFLSLEPIMEKIHLGQYIGELDWVICGVDSDARAESVDIEWIRHVRDQCLILCIPFFLKSIRDGNGKLIKEPELDGQQWLQYPIPRM